MIYQHQEEVIESKMSLGVVLIICFNGSISHLDGSAGVGRTRSSTRAPALLHDLSSLHQQPPWVYFGLLFGADVNVSAQREAAQSH